MKPRDFITVSVAVHMVILSSLRWMQDSNNKNDKKLAKFRKIDILGAFKPLRLLSYFILIIAFFVLLRHGILEPIAFLAGLALMPLGVFCAGVFYGRK